VRRPFLKHRFEVSELQLFNTHIQTSIGVLQVLQLGIEAIDLDTHETHFLGGMSGSLGGPVGGGLEVLDLVVVQQLDSSRLARIWPSY